MDNSSEFDSLQLLVAWTTTEVDTRRRKAFARDARLATFPGEKPENEESWQCHTVATFAHALYVSRRKTKDLRRRKKKDEQFGSLVTFQFSTSVMLFCEFDSLVGYRLGAYESL